MFLLSLIHIFNGNITDVSSMKLCMEEMKTDKVIFIADKGFYSKSNIKTLNDNKLKYIIPDVYKRQQ